MFCLVPRIAAVLTLVVAGTLAPAHAGERPFSASGAGIIIQDQNLIASGFEATHLGRATFNGVLWVVYLDNSGILHIPAYLTAANGDRLYLDCVVDYVVTDVTVNGGIAIGTATFTGGTGRFQDATGSADVMFAFDFSGYYHFDFLIDGSIDY